MKYGKEIVDKLCGYLKKGTSIKSACASVGIGTSTFYDWTKGKSDFSDTIKKAMAIPDRTVENALYKSAIMGHSYMEREYSMVPTKDGTGLKKILVKEVKKIVLPNVTAQIFWTKNRCPEEFKDKQEIDASEGLKAIIERIFTDTRPKENGE